MTGLVVDTSALLAFFDSSEPDHAAVTEVLATTPGPLVVSPYVVAELDYLVATRHGVEAELAVLDELASGAWELPALDRTDLRRARTMIETYSDHSIGAADASNVILSARYRTQVIATLDRRHFGTLRTVDGDSFTILPA